MHSNKVRTPQCIKCGKKKLFGVRRTTSVQLPDDSAIDNVPYDLCDTCFKEHGSIIRIDRKKDQDYGYFSGDRHLRVELKIRISIDMSVASK